MVKKAKKNLKFRQRLKEIKDEPGEFMSVPMKVRKIWKKNLFFFTLIVVKEEVIIKKVWVPKRIRKAFDRLTVPKPPKSKKLVKQLNRDIGKGIDHYFGKVAKPPKGVKKRPRLRK